MSEHRPFWRFRDDPYGIDDLDQYDRRDDPRDDPASPAFEPVPDPLDVEPRIDCFWDEREEDARIRRGLEA
jgi:hypothetical protein